jgi:hypothetical protein
MRIVECRHVFDGQHPSLGIVENGYFYPFGSTAYEAAGDTKLKLNESFVRYPIERTVVVEI